MKAIYNYIFLVFFLLLFFEAKTQNSPPQSDLRMYDIIEEISADRIQKDIEKLVSFGTRHTLSETKSDTRGIGAARRWIKDEFDKISAECGGCMEVYFHTNNQKGDAKSRIKQDVEIVNVVAVLKGTQYPNRYIMMSGDIDSRVSDVMDSKSDSPGANDNASGMAGVLEAARVLSKYSFPSSIVFVGLSGEEQGLFGGKFLAEKARNENWDLLGVLNNDMIGNIEGVDGIIDNSTFRVFSEPTPVTETDKEKGMRRFYGGEIDGVSRQLARYIDTMTDKYFLNLDAIMIYRLDRFGRGGHHRPFNDAGFPGVRIMETHENYTRQHQNLRSENGIEYGDVIEGVNFEYAKKLTGVNAISLAGLAWAPEAPKNVKIKGAVQPSTSLSWDVSNDKHLAGYKIYWRKTTDSQWTKSRYVGKVDNFELEGLVIDNYLFGVAAISADGNESVVVFPN